MVFREAREQVGGGEGREVRGRGKGAGGRGGRRHGKRRKVETRGRAAGHTDPVGGKKLALLKKPGLLPITKGECCTTHGMPTMHRLLFSYYVRSLRPCSFALLPPLLACLFPFPTTIPSSAPYR